MPTNTHLLALPSSSSNLKRLQPHLLPCTIKHSGPIPTSSRHWNPRSTTSSKPEHSGSQEVHFRGRKLRGRVVRLPEGYTGVVATSSEKKVVPDAGRREEQDGEDEGAEEKVETLAMETYGRFDSVVIWGHEAVPEDEDLYVKGTEEWIGFAESIHAFDAPTAP